MCMHHCGAIDRVSPIKILHPHCRAVQDKPYALFGTCLGAIVAYEIAQRAQAQGLPLPLAFFPAAVSPPHLYALAVMKLYLTRSIAHDDASPIEEVMEKLRGWQDLPKKTLMLVRSPSDH